MLVTERFLPELPRMRRPDRGKLIADCMRESASRTFRVVHFSILDDHLHLLVEAGSKRSLSRGMQGLKIRLAKRLNRHCGRGTGKVFQDRFHARALTTPTAVRVALRYVLCNWIKHVAGARGVDPYSSGALVRWVGRSVGAARHAVARGAALHLAGGRRLAEARFALPDGAAGRSSRRRCDRLRQPW